MSSRKRTDGAGGAGKEPQPGLGLTIEETLWAVRYFSAMRRVEQKMADEANGMFVRSAESLAKEYPRHTAPRLRLVTGGAR